MVRPSRSMVCTSAVSKPSRRPIRPATAQRSSDRGPRGGPAHVAARGARGSDPMIDPPPAPTSRRCHPGATPTSARRPMVNVSNASSNASKRATVSARAFVSRYSGSLTTSPHVDSTLSPRRNPARSGASPRRSHHIWRATRAMATTPTVMQRQRVQRVRLLSRSCHLSTSPIPLVAAGVHRTSGWPVLVSGAAALGHEHPLVDHRSARHRAEHPDPPNQLARTADPRREGRSRHVRLHEPARHSRVVL
jgi:hypothetical protein